MHHNTRAKHFFAALFFLVILFFVQELGASFMQANSGEWFLSLQKPTWNPPGWVFQIVWPLLYIAVAFSGYMFWTHEKSPERSKGLFFWTAQLFCNTIWTYVFFALQSPLGGFIDILLVLLCSFGVLYYGRKVSFWIVWSFVLYILWLFYAGFLNLAIVLMNR
ncbi:MAG: TspO/MBR family protein [Chlamydiota bacterium]